MHESTPTRVGGGSASAAGGDWVVGIATPMPPPEPPRRRPRNPSPCPTSRRRSRSSPRLAGPEEPLELESPYQSPATLWAAPSPAPSPPPPPAGELEHDFAEEFPPPERPVRPVGMPMELPPLTPAPEPEPSLPPVEAAPPPPEQPPPVDREPVAAQPAAAPGPDLSSATLAELYFNQGFTDKALDVYRQLLQREPGNERARARVVEIEALDRHSASRGRPGPAACPRRARRRARHAPGGHRARHRPAGGAAGGGQEGAAMSSFGDALRKVASRVPETQMVMVMAADGIPIEKLVVRADSDLEAVAAEYTTLLAGQRHDGRSHGAGRPAGAVGGDREDGGGHRGHHLGVLPVRRPWPPAPSWAVPASRCAWPASRWRRSSSRPGPRSGVRLTTPPGPPIMNVSLSRSAARGTPRRLVGPQGAEGNPPDPRREGDRRVRARGGGDEAADPEGLRRFVLNHAAGVAAPLHFPNPVANPAPPLAAGPAPPAGPPPRRSRPRISWWCGAPWWGPSSGRPTPTPRPS